MSPKAVLVTNNSPTVADCLIDWVEVLRPVGWGHLQGENIQPYIFQSGDDDYLMNETRKKPTTRARCPTLFVGHGWHGILYMLRTLYISRPLITQSWATGGNSGWSVFQVRRRRESTPCQSTTKTLTTIPPRPLSPRRRWNPSAAECFIWKPRVIK